MSEFLLKNKRRERRFPENFAKLEKTAFSYSTPMTASENSLLCSFFKMNSYKWNFSVLGGNLEHRCTDTWPLWEKPSNM